VLEVSKLYFGLLPSYAQLFGFTGYWDVHFVAVVVVVGPCTNLRLPIKSSDL
jgi:hypothetical protein